MEPKEFIAAQKKAIAEAVGQGRALVALSGGVDSSVAAALCHQAAGERLDCLFIDDGLMREGEGAAVKEAFRPLGIKVRVIDEAQRFFAALKGKPDPEEKRKAFRDTFYKVLGEQVRETKANFLVQGTIAADIKETQAGVKTQHNVLEQIGLDPKTWGLEILEPLKTLYKPDVRQVGRALGLPPAITERMPFPGPGLATRVVGEVTPERVETVRKATTIVEEEVSHLRPFQAFAVLLSDRATGLREGKRDFGEIVVVRAVHSSDAMTATAVQAPWEVLATLQERICAEVPGVVKVLYDLTPKPPSTIEYV